MKLDVLDIPADSTSHARTALAEVSQDFEEKYSRPVAVCRRLHWPLTRRTFTTAAFRIPLRAALASTALIVFNDVTLRAGTESGLAIIDLRFGCSSPADYANRIEPSSISGAKIARAIVNLVSPPDAHNGSAKVVAG